MRFYKNEEKKSPVKDFLDALSLGDARRVLWMLKLIEELEWLPAQYTFRHGEDDLFEFRITAEDRNYWVLAFRVDDSWVLFNADFSERFQKAPDKEVRRAAKRKKEYTAGFRLLPVGDLRKYLTVRKRRDAEFAGDFESGYSKFRLGTTLRQIREASGLTQKEVSEKLGVASSKISAIENHADGLELESLKTYLEKLQETLQV